MNLNFLGNLGSAIGHGAKAGFGAVKTGIGKLGEMGGNDEDGGMSGFPMMKRPMPMTPGINPNAPMPILKAPSMGGDSGLINRRESMPNQIPQLMSPNAPAIQPIRDSVNISATNSGPVGGSDMLGSMLDRETNRPAEVENQQTQMLAPRPIGRVRPPDLLGRRGDTLDDTPMGHARYGYQSQYMDDKGHIPRRKQDILMNALHGAALGYQNGGGWQGAIGGAGAGAAGTAIDPTRGRDFRFNQEQVPRLERNRADLERGQDRQYEMQKRGADLRGAEARTAATIAGTKDVGLERQYRMAQIAKMDADAEAKRTGRPQKFMDYDPESGQFRNAFKYPDGHVEYEGQSGEARLKQEGYQNQAKMNTDRIEGGMARVKESAKGAMDRVRVQQGGANYRAGMSQSGQDRRTDKRLNAQYGDTYVPPQGKAPAVGSVPGAGSGKVASASDVSEYAKMKGITAAEARKRFEDKGYSIR